jgi:hypothetical protein
MPRLANLLSLVAGYRNAAASVWILLTGFWADAGVWDDSETWND